MSLAPCAPRPRRRHLWRHPTPRSFIGLTLPLSRSGNVERLAFDFLALDHSSCRSGSTAEATAVARPCSSYRSGLPSSRSRGASIISAIDRSTYHSGSTLPPSWSLGASIVSAFNTTGLVARRSSCFSTAAAAAAAELRQGTGRRRSSCRISSRDWPPAARPASVGGNQTYV